MLEHDHPHLSTLVCQRCKQPLRVDDSLADLDPSNADRLVVPLLTEDRAQTAKTPHRQVSTSQQASKALDPVSRRVIPSPNVHPSSSSSHPRSVQRDSLPPGPAESYVMLTRSQIGSPMTTPSSSDHTAAASNGPVPSSSSEDSQQRNNHNLSHRLKVANRLFDIMSARSDIDHPMCQECTDMLLDSLSRQLADVSRERDCYIDFLKKVNSGMSEEEQEDLKKDIAEITAAEQATIESLRETERQRDALKEELCALEEESKELDELEESYWQDFNAFQIKLQTFHNERDSVNLKYDHDARQLERLQKTNVYKDTFCISHEGHFGTINGFRLGRLPNQPVEWTEINAAWGQTLLLLYTMANKLKFTFKTYRLLPLGSFSRIEKIDGDHASYELYGTGDFAIPRVLFNRKFDMAMVAFLNCLEQLCDYAERQDPNLKFPYRINKEKGMIGDASIKLTLNQDEMWTRALKYTLTNTKWILIFASSAGISPAASSVPPTPTTTGPDGRMDSPRAESFGERIGGDRGKRGSAGSLRGV